MEGQFKTYNDLTILAVDGKIGSYTAALCRCNLCLKTSRYKRAEVVAGKAKRCQQCNIEKKVKKCGCSHRKMTFESRNMVHSKRFGKICRKCYTSMVIVPCKMCNIVVDTSNGNHSGYCKNHWNFHRVAYMLIAGAQSRAKSKKIEFNLDIDWIKERLLTCEVTGIPFKYPEIGVSLVAKNYNNRDPLTPSVDKIKPELGYTKDNCRIVCWWYNLAKSNWEDSEIKWIVTEWFKNKEKEVG